MTHMDLKNKKKETKDAIHTNAGKIKDVETARHVQGA
jgi:hypothetical protein